LVLETRGGWAYTGNALNSPHTFCMGRITILFLVLAALFVAAANGSPASSTKTHKNAPPATASHNTRKKTQPMTARGVRRTTGHTAGHAVRHGIGRAALSPQSRVGKSRTAAPVRRSRSQEGSPAKTSTRKAELAARKTEADPRKAELPAQGTEVTSAKAEKTAHEEDDAIKEVPAKAPEVPARRAKNSGGRAVLKSASLRVTRGVMPPPLKGSRESLERQNERTEAEGLERIEDEDDLADRIARKMLVPVPVSVALEVNGNLPESHRYCRPWTARFLTDLARSHAAEFHRPLEVSSAVRTVEYQKRLMGINGNAAAAEGDIVSPHLTGATIDIAKSGLGLPEVAWMRTRLLALEEAGKIDVEEEFQQACFHITVYKSYAPAVPAVTRKPSQRRPAPRPQIAAEGE